jgi:hypothetical protein
LEQIPVTIGQVRGFLSIYRDDKFRQALVSQLFAALLQLLQQIPSWFSTHAFTKAWKSFALGDEYGQALNDKFKRF